MTPDIDWKAALEAEHASLPKRLERVALLAENANYWTDVHRLMPAAGVADILYEALDENARLREALGKALERLGASAFTNSEHAQAAEILRAALAEQEKDDE